MSRDTANQPNATNEKRYSDELAFLSQGGKELAQAFPRLANTLSQPSRDPDVERLLEGIAYRCGQVVGKLADEVPRLIQLMMDLYFPHYLCPVPATAVVEAKADRPTRIPRGTEFRSVPVQGTVCRFTSAYDIDAGPLQVNTAQWKANVQGAELTLAFSNAISDPTAPDRLRVFLHGEPLVAATLYQWLLTKVTRVEWLDAQGRDGGILSRVRFAPLGFTDDQALLPFPPGVPSALRLLREFFTLPQKFLFVDVQGIWSEALRRGIADGRFGLRITMSNDGHVPLQVTAQNFRLGCSPVANVFEHTADPVWRKPTTHEIFVKPAGPTNHFAVYSILDVQGIGTDGARSYALTHDSVELSTKQHGVAQFFREQTAHEQECSLLLREHAEWKSQEQQTVLIDALCTNGELPTGLRVGDISRSDSPNIKVSNITALTPTHWPPRGEALRQSLLTHLALAREPIHSLDSLRGALKLYSFRASDEASVAQEQQLWLSALRRVTTRMDAVPYGGEMVRCLRSEVELDESTFGSEGELYLFGCILDELLARQSPINMLSQMTLRGHRNKKAYAWPMRPTAKS